MPIQLPPLPPMPSYVHPIPNLNDPFSGLLSAVSTFYEKQPEILRQKQAAELYPFKRLEALSQVLGNLPGAETNPALGQSIYDMIGKELGGQGVTLPPYQAPPKTVRDYLKGTQYVNMPELAPYLDMSLAITPKDTITGIISTTEEAKKRKKNMEMLAPYTLAYSNLVKKAMQGIPLSEEEQASSNQAYIQLLSNPYGKEFLTEVHKQITEFKAQKSAALTEENITSQIKHREGSEKRAEKQLTISERNANIAEQRLALDIKIANLKAQGKYGDIEYLQLLKAKKELDLEQKQLNIDEKIQKNSPEALAEAATTKIFKEELKAPANFMLQNDPVKMKERKAQIYAEQLQKFQAHQKVLGSSKLQTTIQKYKNDPVKLKKLYNNVISDPTFKQLSGEEQQKILKLFKE